MQVNLAGWKIQMIPLFLIIQFSLGPYFILTSTEHFFPEPVTSVTLWPAECIILSPVSEEKRPAVRLNLIISSCDVVFTPPLFQHALHSLPLQLLTNKSENAWLLCINMETHLFKEKRGETFHLINSKRWSYCYEEILHWCISLFKTNIENKHGKYYLNCFSKRAMRLTGKQTEK